MHPSLSIGERIEAIRSQLPDGVRLVAVSKFHPSKDIVEAYEAGQRHFGESRVQELVSKHEDLESICLDIQWHFIGPLQTNKVKYIAPFVKLIESVDSLRLLEEINKQAIKHHRRINVLLEVHIAQEESKGGLDPEALMELLKHMRTHASEFQGIRIVGLMAMASNTDDQDQIADEFASMQRLHAEVHASGLLLDPEAFVELSMGMSGDYQIALRYGATLVRIGSAIFGDRDSD